MSELRKKKFKTKVQVKDIIDNSVRTVTIGEPMSRYGKGKHLYFNGLLVIDRADALALADFIYTKFEARK